MSSAKTSIGWLVAESRQQPFERGHQPGYARVVRPMSLQGVEHWLVTEAGIGAEAQLSDLRRYGDKAGLQ